MKTHQRFKHVIWRVDNGRVARAYFSRINLISLACTAMVTLDCSQPYWSSLSRCHQSFPRSAVFPSRRSSLSQCRWIKPTKRVIEPKSFDRNGSETVREFNSRRHNIPCWRDFQAISDPQSMLLLWEDVDWCSYSKYHREYHVVHGYRLTHADIW